MNASDEAWATELVGTPGFIAPEIIFLPRYDARKVDSWSLGCVTIELVRGGAWFAEEWMRPFLEVRAAREWRASDRAMRGWVPKRCAFVTGSVLL